MRLSSGSERETFAIGRDIGRLLKGGDVIALTGDLGAGKTTMAKGIAAGLSVDEAEANVTSPTFALVHEYEGREKIYHMDWYRLEALKGADRDLAEECFDSGAVSLVEWPERGERSLPEGRLEISIRRGKSASSRAIEISAPGGGHEILLKKMGKR